MHVRAIIFGLVMGLMNHIEQYRGNNLEGRISQ